MRFTVIRIDRVKGRIKELINSTSTKKNDIIVGDPPGTNLAKKPIGFIRIIDSILLNHNIKARLTENLHLPAGDLTKGKRPIRLNHKMQLNKNTRLYVKYLSIGPINKGPSSDLIYTLK